MVLDLFSYFNVRYWLSRYKRPKDHNATRDLEELFSEETQWMKGLGQSPVGILVMGLEQELYIAICCRQDIKRPWARSFKVLRSPRIDSTWPITPGFVAWQAGMTTLSYSVPSPHRLFKISSTFCCGHYVVGNLLWAWGWEQSAAASYKHGHKNSVHLIWISQYPPHWIYTFPRRGARGRGEGV